MNTTIRTTLSFHPRWITWMVTAPVILLVGLACYLPRYCAAQGVTGATDNFVQQPLPAAPQLPVTARSRFFNIAANPDFRNTAEHELFHGVGFTIAYTDFAARVGAPAAGTMRRNFTTGGGATIAVLGRPANATHVDPAVTLPGGGFNQANSIMRPDQVVGQRLQAFDRDILNAAFGWTGRNLNVVVGFGNAFTAAQQTTINDAAAAVETLFGSNQMGHIFQWQVLNGAARPVRGVPQITYDSGFFHAPFGLSEQYNNFAGTSLSLTDILLTPIDGSVVTAMVGDDETTSFGADLTAQGMLTHAGLGILDEPVSVNLTGLVNLITYDADMPNPFPEPSTIPGPDGVDSFETEMLSMSLTGMVATSMGPLSVLLQESPSLASLGETNFISLDSSSWAVDSFFDVFTEITIGGQMMASNGSLYIDFVPEPTSSAILVLGMIGLVACRNRQFLPFLGHFSG